MNQQTTNDTEFLRIKRERKDIVIPDPVPVDPVENLRSILRDVRVTGFNDERRVDEHLKGYEFTLGDLLYLLAIIEESHTKEHLRKLLQIITGER